MEGMCAFKHSQFKSILVFEDCHFTTISKKSPGVIVEYYSSPVDYEFTTTLEIPFNSITEAAKFYDEACGKISTAIKEDCSILIYYKIDNN